MELHTHSLKQRLGTLGLIKFDYQCCVWCVDEYWVQVRVSGWDCIMENSRVNHGE